MHSVQLKIEIPGYTGRKMIIVTVPVNFTIRQAVAASGIAVPTKHWYTLKAKNRGDIWCEYPTADALCSRYDIIIVT